MAERYQTLRIVKLFSAKRFATSAKRFADFPLGAAKRFGAIFLLRIDNRVSKVIID